MKRKYLYTILAALAIAGVAFFFFFPDDVEGNVLQQHDTMQGLANGQEVKAYTEATGETSRWTDSLFGGMPNFQIAPSYKAESLLGWIGKLYTLWLPYPANLLFAMMIGFFIMLLCMKQKWPLALFGAVAWGLSSYFIIIIGAGHIWKFVTLSYIPPTIGGIVLCYRGKYLAGTALASLFGALQLMSNHPQMSYYFLFVVFFMMLAWLWTAIKEKKVGRWAIATCCVVFAGIIGVAANAASLYNTYEYSKETVRGRATELTPIKTDGQQAEAPAGEGTGMSRSAITAWSYGLDETWSLLIPNVKGGATIKPEGGETRMLSLAETEKADELDLTPQELMFLQNFPQYFGDQPMTNGPVYVGAFVLLLALLALFVVDTPMKWALFAVSLLAIFLSWGHNFSALTDFFIDSFPGYNKFRAVASILVIVEFTLPLLAVMAVKKILDTPDFLKRYKWTFYGVAGFCAAVCLIGWLAPSVFGSGFSAAEKEQLTQMGAFAQPEYANVLNAVKQIRYSLVSADCLRSLMYIILGFLVVYLYLRKAYTSKTMMVCALTAIVLIDLFSVNKRYINSDSFVEQQEQAAFVPTEADKAIMRDKGHYRVLDQKDFNGARSSYFHNTIGGYHAAKLTRYNDLLERQIYRGNPAVLNMLNTKYVMNGDQYMQNPDALGNAWLVDTITYVATPDAEMKALDTLNPRRHAVADRKFEEILGVSLPAAAGDTIYQTSYAPNRIAYKARSASGGIAVFSEIYFPWGWTATVDGQPVSIGRVNYVLRALRLPAGDHTIQFEFNPKSTEVTEGISVASVIIIYVICAGAIALAIAGALRQRRKGKEESSK